MKKIGRIILGWYYWMTNRNNILAKARLEVCVKCPSRKWNVCQECGCVLQAKARLKEEECPLDKWPKFGHRFEDYSDQIIFHL